MIRMTGGISSTICANEAVEPIACAAHHAMATVMRWLRSERSSTFAPVPGVNITLLAISEQA